MLSTNNELQWFALVVRSQHEKIVGSVLQEKGYEELLPLYSIRRRWSDRMKQLMLPLFPGYVFCRFDLNHRLPILVTPGVLQVVGEASFRSLWNRAKSRLYAPSSTPVLKPNPGRT